MDAAACGLSHRRIGDRSRAQVEPLALAPHSTLWPNQPTGVFVPDRDYDAAEEAT
jgi:hypothetical protein